MFSWSSPFFSYFLLSLSQPAPQSRHNAPPNSYQPLQQHIIFSTMRVTDTEDGDLDMGKLERLQEWLKLPPVDTVRCRGSINGEACKTKLHRSKKIQACLATMVKEKTWPPTRAHLKLCEKTFGSLAGLLLCSNHSGKDRSEQTESLRSTFCNKYLDRMKAEMKTCPDEEDITCAGKSFRKPPNRQNGKERKQVETESSEESGESEDEDTER